MIQCGLAYSNRPATRQGRSKLVSRSLFAIVYRGPHVFGAMLGMYAIIFTYLSTAQLTHAKRVQELERLMTIGLLDAESGQRAYLLTGDSAFLVQYQAGLKALATHQAVYKITLVDERSRKNCIELESLLRRKTDEMALTIAIHDKVSPAAALDVVNKRSGYLYSETICRMLREIQKTEADRVAPFQFWGLPGDTDIHGPGIAPALSSL